MYFLFFFFQAEDGIRDKLVTGVQTCALPIFSPLPIRSWTGAFDSLWTSPGNWNPAGTPIKGDSVVIPLTANNPVLRTVIQEINLGGLSIAAGAKDRIVRDRKSTRLNSSH